MGSEDNSIKSEFGPMSWSRPEMEAGEERFEVRTLQGLQRLYLAVEIFAPGVGDKIPYEKLLSEIRSHLEEMGLTPLDQMEDPLEEFPTLLSFNLVCDEVINKGPGIYVFGVRMEVLQTVHLERVPEIKTLAITWTTGLIGMTLKQTITDTLRAATLDCVKKFSRVYQQANLE